MQDIPNIFGNMVFNDKVMKQRLPKEVYKALKRTIAEQKHLNLDVANIVATAMKEWAIEKGATHFTHWFQPLTGVTAEKHDSFISPVDDGNVIMEFSGKELVRGEPDASSFPSGGIRSTFEARGYTAWDPTSYAFIKDNTLCIPTAFCSYSGEALDKKTPLLRSLQAIDKESKRILKIFGHDNVKRVITTVGPEQEFFLIDKELYQKRPDLIYCGRTLFGARPPKGQELEDHYFASIKPRVSAFMKELDEELWKLGVLAKTKHNEVAPAQHELAPIFTTVNIAADHNQLIMELMKTIANKHDLVCLLHEKPFAGVNGSGKHNNWSISTDTGINLLEPGETPYENAQFLLFLSAVIKAVDEYQDLLRISIANAGNDHRLGANEAPPAIISVFLGDELTAIIESIENDTGYNQKEKTQMEIGATVLPHFPKDTTDRNRTSPFAFTGNKFEFRMLGSSSSISDANVVLNTIVAEALSQFADRLESAGDFKAELTAIIKESIKKHKRIIFNGNNYSEEWVKESEKRGLLNLKSTVEAVPYFISEKNINLFSKHNIFSEAEIHSRYHIMLEEYIKVIHIEALTILDMTKRGIIPSIVDYLKDLTEVVKNKKAISSAINSQLEESLINVVSDLSACLYKNIEKLDNSILEAKNQDSLLNTAKYYREVVFINMQELRSVIDNLETKIGKKYWPFPTYGELLYSVY
ncbi:glutamine synthetase III family protein [Acetivibrio mesophilus]|uniref:Glutamine synthetase type III n=1 Tax=Acetivibrio mesophilus TaxID=2487273 RepID=A0A4Q0I210_9FIRM|nr:glutamine synthetase III [Acetivibrio mesophilus]ODM25969.1 glutamine synthetase [Clostridium sp. Bc-iso-3]RXE58196.1 glutamine synthetase type III [Acetivibrio mesophilus]HHV29251.1 glutamine synthetase type III [Clostridium sp.]